MGCSDQGASTASAGFRKMTVENAPARQRSQVEWCYVSSASVWGPNPSCRGSAGQFIYITALSKVGLGHG